LSASGERQVPITAGRWNSFSRITHGSRRGPAAEVFQDRLPVDVVVTAHAAASAGSRRCHGLSRSIRLQSECGRRCARTDVCTRSRGRHAEVSDIRRAQSASVHDRVIFCGPDAVGTHRLQGAAQAGPLRSSGRNEPQEAVLRREFCSWIGRIKVRPYTGRKAQRNSYPIGGNLA